MKAGLQPGTPRPVGPRTTARPLPGGASTPVSVPSGPATGLQAPSYAEFIQSYAAGAEPAPVKRFGTLDQVAFQNYAESIVGEGVPSAYVDSLEQHVMLSARILDRIAPLVARQARKMTEAGLVDFGPAGGTLTRTSKKSHIDKRQDRSKKIGACVRRKMARIEIGATSAFNLQAPGDVLTTRKHRNNYGVTTILGTTKVLGNLAAGGAAAGYLVQGAAEVAAIVPLAWHSATIDGVTLAKMSATEQAKCKVLLNFAAAEAVVRSRMKGERPDAQLGMQSLEFWSALAAWPEGGMVMAAAIREHLDSEGPDQQGALRTAELNAVRNAYDVKQAKTGWTRDVLGAVPLGLTAIGRAAFYFMGDMMMAGSGGPMSVLAGMFHDMPQGFDEHLWASATKEHFRWRFDQLEKLENEAAKSLRHREILLTTMLYCARKKDIADTEMTIALTRVLSGFLRASGGAVSFAALGPALGMGIAAGTAAVAGKAGAALIGVGFVAFQGLMYYRQHLRQKEAHAQKEGERSGEAVKATRDFDALCDTFMNGFKVTRGKGRLVNGDVGYSRVKGTTYGSGGNEMLAWEMMAREIVDGFRDGEPLSFPMKMLLSLGLGILDADALEQGVLAKLHAGDDAGAVDAVEKVIRGLLAAPPARASEAIQPRVFKPFFEAAEKKAKHIDGIGALADDETIAACLFNARQDGGLAVDRAAFQRSMEVLDEAFAKRGPKAGGDGVYRRMLQFSRTLAPAKADSAALRHLRAWAQVADRGAQAGWTPALQRSHLRIGQLLARAEQQQAGPWRKQVGAALDASAGHLQAGQRAKLNQVLLADLQALQADGMLAGQVGLVAQELSGLLAPADDAVAKT